jgi:L-rhamnose mutarotase
VIGVKPDRLDDYKKLHANPWPSVNKALKDAHIRNYSIYLTQLDDGNWRLFSYFEYTGDNFDADMKKLAATDDVQRWWKETEPCQIPLRTRKADEWWKGMEEVYHLD